MYSTEPSITRMMIEPTVPQIGRMMASRATLLALLASVVVSQGDSGVIMGIAVLKHYDIMTV